MTQTETLELLVATLQQANSSQSESIERLTRQNEQLQNKLQELLAQVAWLNRQLFGRKSEKLAHLDPNQLSLFDPPVQPLEHEIPEEAAAQEPVCSTTPKKKVRQNRNMLDGLPVVEIVIEPEGVDPDKYKRIGEERTRTLEFEPGKLYVKEIIRPKYGLKDNISLPQGHQGSVIIAPLPLLPIYKGLPGASLLTEILLQKYEYHVPFYRQVREFHHLGLKISENTLQGWFKPACELLKPLYEELKEQVLKADYIQVDETTLPVINKQNHKAVKEYLWIVRAVMDGLVFFHYDDGSRSQETAWKLLQTFKGYLQSDITRLPKKRMNPWPDMFWLKYSNSIGSNRLPTRRNSLMSNACLEDRNRHFPYLSNWKNGWKQPIRKCFLKAGWGKLSLTRINFGHV